MPRWWRCWTGRRTRPCFSGYRFGAQVETVRSLVLGMEADDYRVIELNLDLACGAMQGVMKLILPEPTAEEMTRRPGRRPGPVAWAATLIRSGRS